MCITKGCVKFWLIPTRPHTPLPKSCVEKIPKENESLSRGTSLKGLGFRRQPSIGAVKPHKMINKHSITHYLVLCVLGELHLLPTYEYYTSGSTSST